MAHLMQVRKLNSHPLRKRILSFRIRREVKRLTLFGPFERIILWTAALVPRFRLGRVDQQVGDLLGLVQGRLALTFPANSPSAAYLLRQAYEPDVTNLFRRLVDSGMTIVDVGANVGYYSLLAADLVGPAGRIYAFEPDSRSYEYLLHNLKTNHANNVFAVKMAITDRAGTENFLQGDVEQSYVTDVPGKATVDVEATTLDAFFASEGWPPVDLIKMDIEGSEHAALQGMRETVLKNPDLHLIMEFNLVAIRRARTSVDALSQTLRDLGFDTAYAIEKGLREFPLSVSLPSSQFVLNYLIVKKRPVNGSKSVFGPSAIKPSPKRQGR
jgi:FkbM family methyltransferase